MCINFWVRLTKFRKTLWIDVFIYLFIDVYCNFIFNFLLYKTKKTYKVAWTEKQTRMYPLPRSNSRGPSCPFIY